MVPIFSRGLAALLLVTAIRSAGKRSLRPSWPTHPVMFVMKRRAAFLAHRDPSSKRRCSRVARREERPFNRHAASVGSEDARSCHAIPFDLLVLSPSERVSDCARSLQAGESIAACGRLRGDNPAIGPSSTPPLSSEVPSMKPRFDRSPRASRAALTPSGPAPRARRRRVRLRRVRGQPARARYRNPHRARRNARSS